MKNNLVKFFILFMLLSPLVSEAQIVITEVMYNLEGTDTGFEWIELYNDGSDSVDLTDWKLFENDTNHRINNSIEGESPVLNPNSYAVVADNPNKFKQSNSDYNGLLFDSAFSLSNSGETLIIRNPDLIDIDNISYNPEIGADGDGNSLQLIGGTWVSSNSTPGIANSSASTNISQENNEVEKPLNPTLSAEQEMNLMKQNIIIDAGGNRKVIVGADTLFKAFAVGKENVPLKNARYSWVLGDGSKKEGESVLYTYKYPGDYVVILNVSSDEYTASDRVIVTALPADIIISNVDVFSGFIELYNRSNYELDLSWWNLSSGDYYFSLPEDTIILPNKKLKFPSSVTNLSLNDLNRINLLYPNMELVHHYTGDMIEEVIVSAQNIKNNQIYTTPKEEFSVETKEEKIYSDKSESAEDNLAFVGGLKDSNNNLLNKWTFSLGGIMLVSIAGALFVGKTEDRTDLIAGEEGADEDSLKPEDFTIID